ncbi:sugar transferase [Micrococcales bacterium 31B]|nr:sugar transferase [Micrococcales bacterium 31B]
MSSPSAPGRRYDTYKRILDATVGGLGLVASAPLQLGVALLVRKKLGSPVLFAQERPGLGGKPFTMYKFRSMLDADETRGLTSDADRLTGFGKALRATSLDELPALWNVVKGDMSLVGPRPLLMRYLPRYSAFQARRHEVRPGITGLAQVSGRNSITWEQKFALDVEYVDTRSFLLDVKILVATVTKVFKRDGIAAEGEATMTEFMGSDSPQPRA